MIKRGLQTIAFLACGGVLTGQNITPAELPALLAKTADRQKVISFVNASRSERLPLLLRLSTAPTPVNVDPHDLYVGLADAFGALKTTEAIPFLLTHIVLPRDELIYEDGERC